ncbi:hypothetical protein BRADI_1g69917v3 [Brachypodium distachyon]|uniref:Uncharacterized protein n=1 Tax=Brachypodium distachyon TaxID=15368 RepID=I1H833_BRADI|nr:hypothetical protein BRADI_1g69917v3 [Brachypodium distachyon]
MALSLLRARLSVQGRSYATGIAKAAFTGNNATKVLRTSGNNDHRRHFSAGAAENNSSEGIATKTTTKSRRGYTGLALLGFAGGLGLHYLISSHTDRKLSDHLKGSDHKCLSEQTKAEVQRCVDSKLSSIQTQVNYDVLQSIRRVDNAISRSRSEDPHYLLQLRAEIREELLTIRRSYHEMEEKNQRTLPQLRAADEAKLAGLQRESAEMRKEIGKQPRS